jgi:hypothetical protein
MKKRTLKDNDSRFLRAKQGASKINIGLNSFLRLSKEAGATVKYGEIALHDMDKIYSFLEGLEK